MSSFSFCTLRFISSIRLFPFCCLHWGNLSCFHKSEPLVLSVHIWHESATLIVHGILTSFGNVFELFQKLSRRRRAMKCSTLYTVCRECRDISLNILSFFIWYMSHLFIFVDQSLYLLLCIFYSIFSHSLVLFNDFTLCPDWHVLVACSCIRCIAGFKNLLHAPKIIPQLVSQFLGNHTDGLPFFFTGNQFVACRFPFSTVLQRRPVPPVLSSFCILGKRDFISLKIQPLIKNSSQAARKCSNILTFIFWGAKPMVFHSV